MAFSFSKKENEAKGESQGNTGNITAHVLTMEDDLKNFTSEGSSHSKDVSPVKKDVPKETSSPFSPAPGPSKKIEEKAPQAPQAPSRPDPMLKNETHTNVPNVPQPLPQDSDVVAQKKGKTLMVVGGVVMLIAFIGGGAYYYLFILKKNKIEPLVEPQVQEIVQTEPKKEVVLPKELPYATDKPNYLPLNVEVVSENDIYSTLAITASRIRDNSFVNPVEFLVTDQNNNPLAFSRFAILAKLKIHPQLLATLDESFSLYFFNDSGMIRIGLRVMLKDAQLFQSTIISLESELPLSLQPLFLDNKNEMPKKAIFKSNIFVSQDAMTQTQIEYPLRYININIDQRFAIDYAVVGKEWYVGTSRETLKALLSNRKK